MSISKQSRKRYINKLIRLLQELRVETKYYPDICIELHWPTPKKVNRKKIKKSLMRQKKRICAKRHMLDVTFSKAKSRKSKSHVHVRTAPRTNCR